jgi:hypothetical protein
MIFNIIKILLGKNITFEHVLGIGFAVYGGVYYVLQKKETFNTTAFSKTYFMYLLIIDLLVLSLTYYMTKPTKKQSKKIKSKPQPKPSHKFHDFDNICKPNSLQPQCMVNTNNVSDKDIQSVQIPIYSTTDDQNSVNTDIPLYSS